ncbi:hydrogen gas-evolving membrane-bound hydrogenase subunit E [Liberiplasma polymorphum]|jgi:multicomponent Na+:H+ antiporter subunit B|uniref:hydrogen gas-evolving membrane-bound hydrogenase subunit E n=1 Tax=Liberiplasma polymorphum TaxID=3374570 RepID=UPI003774B827
MFVFYLSMQDINELYNTSLKEYFAEFAYPETGSRNIVTAILLDYRLFDSLFEAGILLIAVSGVIWISKHDIEEKNAQFMIDKYKTPDLFVTFSRLVYPLMLAFGFYVIINGHLSPGGGFQGGAIVATAILILYYIDSEKETDIGMIVTIEKFLYIGILLFASLSIFTRGEFFTNPFTSPSTDVKAIYLVVLNIMVGFKVALGLWTIFTAFLKEGR